MTRRGPVRARGYRALMPTRVRRAIDQVKSALSVSDHPANPMAGTQDFDATAEAYRQAWCSPWVLRPSYWCTGGWIGGTERHPRLYVSHSMRLAWLALQHAATRAEELPAARHTRLVEQIEAATDRVHAAARTIAFRANDPSSDTTSPTFTAALDLAARTVALTDMAHHALDVDHGIDPAGLRRTAALLINDLHDAHRVLDTNRAHERTLGDYDALVAQHRVRWPLVHYRQDDWGYHSLCDPEQPTPVAYRPHWYSLSASAVRHEPTRLRVDPQTSEAHQFLKHARSRIAGSGLATDHPLADQIDHALSRFYGLARITSAYNLTGQRPCYTDGVERAHALFLAAQVGALADLVEERETIITDVDAAALRATATRLALPPAAH